MRNPSQPELRKQLRNAVLTPVFLLLGVAIVLGTQLFRMARSADWVEHSQTVIFTAKEALREVVDQESALRGYLLTLDRTFIHRFENANARASLRRLRHLVEDTPAQVLRVEQMEKTYSAWFTDAEIFIGGAVHAPDNVAESIRLRRKLMDEFRTTHRQFLQIELATRAERVESAQVATQGTVVLSALLFFTLGIALVFVSRRQIGLIASTYDHAFDQQLKTQAELEARAWVRTGHLKLADAIQGEISVSELVDRALAEFARYAGAEIGAIYVQEDGRYRRRAAFAYDPEGAGSEAFARGQGLVGQAAEQKEITVLRDLPSDYVKVRSGVGQHAPVSLVLVPIRSEGITYAVLELGFMRPVEPRVLDIAANVQETLAVGLRSAEYRQRLRDLLAELQRQTEELQTQQEELRVANEELEEQSRALRAAQKQNEIQQAELEQTNENLAQQTTLLAKQNEELKLTQIAVNAKALEVARANRYKSEFLANMSHELRTPLNSSLILAKLLADNKDGNLTPEQVKFAETIYGAGNDLLTLINDILDLSKIEAGKMDVQVTPTTVGRLFEPLERAFTPMARDKGLQLRFEGPRELRLETDGHRTQQILRNLLSNALKFTERGEVALIVQAEDERVAFTVRDTGIGIAPDQHEVIFEAFRQADGTSARKYGGTGLGLSISRDLARLLGGDLLVESDVGRGSAFTLTLPRIFRVPDAVASSPPARAASTSGAASMAAFLTALESQNPASTTPMAQALATPHSGLVSGLVSGPVNGRRSSSAGREAELHAKGRVVLIIEDDPKFAQILLDLAHELNFHGVVERTADEGIRAAARIRPSAIILDMGLPDHSGLSVLDRLKRDPTTRHVPVHVISASDFSQEAMAMGAIGYFLKPVKREDLVTAFKRLEATFSQKNRRLLVVEDEPRQRESVTKLLAGDGIEIIAVGTVREALNALRTSTFDCVVTDLSLPDASGYELLETMAQDEAYAFPPVIVYTGRSLTAEEEQRLRRYSSAIIVKGARSPERLLDEVTLFLHQVEADLPAERQRMLRHARDRESLFEGRSILIVEDDVRNVFALTSVLEPRGAKVVIARNGREALEVLDKQDGIDLILMDIMMPEMDGLEATREIRKRPARSKVPIIALTAKAMRDDHERCLQAGANDYIAKPLDVEMLLSLLRVWMPR